MVMNGWPATLTDWSSHVRRLDAADGRPHLEKRTRAAGMIDPQVSATNRKLAVHLLDVGTEDYGDSVLIEARGSRILIDGGHRADFRGSAGHPSIPEQLRTLTREQRPRIDLLVATHTHLDHIGCLPELVSAPTIDVAWALLA